MADRVGHAGAGEELRLQFLLRFPPSKFGHFQSAFRQRIGEHHSWSARMGFHDGKPLPVQRRKREYTTYCSQFLAAVTTHDACFTEQSFYVIEQFVGIGDVFNIKQLHGRVGFWIEVLVHILQHILDANLFPVTDGPNAVELESLDDGTLQNEDSSGTGAADKIDTLRMQLGNRLREDAMMVAIEQSDAVRTYQVQPPYCSHVSRMRCSISAPALVSSPKPRRDDDKGTCLFVTCQQFHRVRGYNLAGMTSTASSVGGNSRASWNTLMPCTSFSLGLTMRSVPS